MKPETPLRIDFNKHWNVVYDITYLLLVSVFRALLVLLYRHFRIVTSELKSIPSNSPRPKQVDSHPLVPRERVCWRDGSSNFSSLGRTQGV